MTNVKGLVGSRFRHLKFDIYSTFVHFSFDIASHGRINVYAASEVAASASESSAAAGWSATLGM